MDVKTLSVGPVQANCYIVSNQSKECIIFDPGEEGNRIISTIQSQQLKPLAIFLTHAHFDHIGAVDELRQAFHIPVYIHKEEEDWLMDPNKNGSGKYVDLQTYRLQPADYIIEKEQTFVVGGMKFHAVFTPGHSPGSISYIFEDDGFAIVGDTLFQGSIGRTDLIGGSLEVLLKSIHEKLLVLPDDFIIYPGHGGYTTPAHEMDTNPFLHGF
ncbi:glyoxylase-like metal-dependent hydrolase (beta-lactamase superfamily II) [Ureibacillus thermosphaericus]|uniref:Glyoxylase-like metal-dependent hydrolase (Beta-lactamase superfamily II) n=1 Tax=Ureibacillus thermosphaericus TaxID=51173 RepID=A0A840PVR5_URETH|nr:glyoxylase-like metal-dependent hydrolase (beta-lactamase superfamily II) [Ureibacillus thermosphaericus]